MAKTTRQSATYRLWRIFAKKRITIARRAANSSHRVIVSTTWHKADQKTTLVKDAPMRRNVIRIAPLRCALALFPLLFTPILTGESAITPVTAMLLSSTTPAGGTAQIALMLPYPLALVTGSVSVDLDATVFDDITAITVFSATGDHVGVANIQGRHAEVQFTSNFGGIGRLPSHPVLQLTVPVLSTAALGSSGAIKMQSQSPWRDLTGGQYKMSFQSPGIKVADGMSIRSVVPGGGPLPSGTPVQIQGQGFSASTKLQLDGVAWSNLQFVNSRQLNFTLGAPADLTGKLLILTDTNGSQTRCYSYLTPSAVRRPAGFPPGIQPIFSQVTYAASEVQNAVFALENANTIPVDIVLQTDVLDFNNGNPPRVTIKTTKRTIVIEPGGVYVGLSSELAQVTATTYIFPTSAIRLAGLNPRRTTRQNGQLPLPAQFRCRPANWSPGIFKLAIRHPLPDCCTFRRPRAPP